MSISLNVFCSEDMIEKNPIREATFKSSSDFYLETLFITDHTINTINPTLTIQVKTFRNALNRKNYSLSTDVYKELARLNYDCNKTTVLLLNGRKLESNHFYLIDLLCGLRITTNN